MDQFVTPETISATFSVLIIPIIGFISKFIIMFLKSKVSELEQKIKNDTLNKYISIAEDAIETAVVSVNQTFVDNIKKQGTFDKETAGKSFDLAKQKAISIMGTSVKNALTDAYNDLDAWIDSKIEVCVRQNKVSVQSKPFEV
ncbi:MAG: hypothetical protein Q8942_08815 [Bacillota bacterium]|nr:hypothetical protein [Bacillota bacterium]